MLALSGGEQVGKQQNDMLGTLWKPRIWSFFGQLIPEALFRPGFLLRDPPRFLVTAVPIAPEQARELINLARRHDVVAIDLDPTMALKREMMIPIAAAARADDVIRLQMRQSMPAQAAGLVWQSEKRGRRGQEVTYASYVTKEGSLREIEQLVAKAGATVSEFRFRGVKAPALLTSAQVAMQTPRLWIAATLLGVVLLTCWTIWTIEVEVRNVEESNASLVASNQQLEERLVSLTQSNEEMAATRMTLQSDLARFDQGRGWLRYIGDLTRNLPDSTWVSELNIDENGLMLYGFTKGQPSEVLAVVQSQPWASNVRLDGAVQYDGYTQQNRFGLVVTLSKPEQ